MAEQDHQRRRHFILEGTAETERFRSPPRGGGGSAVPDRDRNQHGDTLLRQIEALRPQVTAALDVQKAAGLEEGLGLQVEFESFPDIKLTLNSIAELRRAKETAEFFDALPPGEQPAWLEDLLGRTAVPEEGSEVPLVVSIRAPEVDVELYSAIANQIAAPVAVEV